VFNTCSCSVVMLG